MIEAVESVIGQYVQLNGDGIASLNMEWIVGAIFVIMFLWFLFRLSLKIFDLIAGIKK